MNKADTYARDLSGSIQAMFVFAAPTPSGRGKQLCWEATVRVNIREPYAWRFY